MPYCSPYNVYGLCNMCMMLERSLGCFLQRELLSPTLVDYLSPVQVRLGEVRPGRGEGEMRVCVLSFC